MKRPQSSHPPATASRPRNILVIERQSLTSILFRSNARRFNAAPWIIRILVIGLFAAVLFSLWNATGLMGQRALTSANRIDLAWTAIREDIFWLLTVPTLVLCYTTFESFYRSADSRFLSLLPIDGRRYLHAVIGRAYLVHLPLFLPAAFYSAHLHTLANPELATYCGAWTALTFVMAIPVSLAMHVAAGNSSVGGGSRLKSYLSSGVIANEAAFLLYSPVAALAAIMAIGIFSDLLLFESLVTGRAKLSWAPVAWTAFITFFAWKTAREQAGENFFSIFAKFSEADVPLSYGDDGAPVNEGRLLFGWLAKGAAGLYFQRDDRQLRRRHRLDKILVVLFPLVLLRLNAGDSQPLDVFWTCIAPMVGFVALLLIAPFRTNGSELQSPWLERSLPHTSSAQWLGGLLAEGVYPFWTWATAGVFCFLYAEPLEAIKATAWGLMLVVALVVSARALAHAGEPGRSGLSALLWRLACLSLIGVLLWQR